MKQFWNTKNVKLAEIHRQLVEIYSEMNNGEAIVLFYDKKYPHSAGVTQRLIHNLVGSSSILRHTA